MSDWLSFEGRVEPLVWGKVTYTILRLPGDVSRVLETARVKRVEGEINDHPVNLALTRAPDLDGVFLWAGQSLLERVGIVPFEPIEVRLRPAIDDLVETPDDMEAAFRRIDVLEAWEKLKPGKRRGLIYKISTAKTAQTREKRISALAQQLEEGTA